MVKKKSPQKILLLGAKGMLGHEIRSVFRGDPSFKLYGLSHKQADITDPGKLESVIKKVRPAVLINAAAYTAVDDCEKNRRYANRVNGTGVKNLAQSCRRHGAVLLHISTESVFNGKAGDYKENAPLSPINAYGRSKAMGERCLRKYATKYYLVRTSWLYGKNGKNFVDTIVRLGRGEPFLKVVDDQLGRPTYAKDLALEIKRILTRGRPYGVYHVTNAGTCSWFDFAREILRLKRVRTPVLPINSRQLNRPAKRAGRAVLVNTKLKGLRTWQAALREYLRDTRR